MMQSACDICWLLRCLRFRDTSNKQTTSIYAPKLLYLLLPLRKISMTYDQSPSWKCKISINRQLDIMYHQFTSLFQRVNMIKKINPETLWKQPANRMWGCVKGVCQGQKVFKREQNWGQKQELINHWISWHENRYQPLLHSQTCGHVNCRLAHCLKNVFLFT